MAISIAHRATGDGMAIFGAMGLIWWLVAAASGPDAYAAFQYYVWQAAPGDMAGHVANILCRIVLIGLSWAFFQHLFSGLRHFVLDMGAGYELQSNRTWSLLVFVMAIVATAALWFWLLVGRA